MASSTPVFETLAALPPHDPSVKQKAAAIADYRKKNGVVAETTAAAH